MPTEEESLIQWILSMDKHSILSRVMTVCEIACLLVTQHEKPAYVGKTWVHSFISHYNTLKSKYNHKYDYQQAKCEDLELITDWFRHVQSTIIEYRILNDDIYNFDETGFQMGVILTAK